MQPSDTNSGRLYTLLGGLALITVGLIFLIQNITGLRFGNWWAIFILIPTIVSFVMFWQSYRATGQLTAQSRGYLTGGLVTLVVASVLLFDLDFGKIWPVFIIIAGLSSLLWSTLGRQP